MQQPPTAFPPPGLVSANPHSLLLLLLLLPLCCRYAKEFIQGAKAAGVPACATVAVVDGAGVVLDSNKKHT